MKVAHNFEEKKGEFFIQSNNKKQASMTYTMAGPIKFIIDHTEVDDAFKGKGLGYALVEESVNYARTNNMKILPLCPFAKAVFNKRPEYQDVLF